MRKYSKSHGLGIPDALIAATAIIEELPLLTLNVKDFRYIDTLSLCDLQIVRKNRDSRNLDSDTVIR